MTNENLNKFYQLKENLKTIELDFQKLVSKVNYLETNQDFMEGLIGLKQDHYYYLKNETTKVYFQYNKTCSLDILNKTLTVPTAIVQTFGLAHYKDSLEFNYKIDFNKALVFGSITEISKIDFEALVNRFKLKLNSLI